MEQREIEVGRLVAERDALIHQRNDLMNQRDALILERDSLLNCRNDLEVQRNKLLNERNDLESERNALLNERNALLNERSASEAQHDDQMNQRDGLQAQRDVLEAQRNDLMLAQDLAMHERDTLMQGRDLLMRERDVLMQSRDVLMQERDRLVDDRDAIYRDRDMVRCQLAAIAPLLAPALQRLTVGNFNTPTPHPLDLSGTILCCGYWGSGNGIAAAMLERLLPDPPPPANPVMGILRDVAASRTTALIEETARLSPEYGYNRFGIATFQDSTASLSLYSDVEDGEDAEEQTIDLFGIPIANALHEHVFKTHEACGPHIKNLVAHGAHVVLAVRHPLDILVSIANKGAGGGVDLLDDKPLLRRVAAQMRSYFRSFDDIPSDRIFYSRYEDIIADFSDATQALTRFAARARSEALDSSRIGPELLDMDLSLPGHRWKPGAGKWQRYLTSGIVDIIRDEGIPELATHLGYAPPDLSLLDDDSMREKIVLREISDTPSLMFLLHGSLQSAEAVDAIRHHAPKTIVGPVEDGIFYLAQHQDAADRFQALLADPRFRALLLWH